MSLVVDAPRAFALTSLAFYLVFVAAAYALALRIGLVTRASASVGSHGTRP